MGYTHGTKWDMETIKKKVLEVMQAFELNRMPTRKECEEYFHDSSLANAITRRGGWYSLADEMGLRMKECQTNFGKSHEALAAEKLQALGFQVRRMVQNFPYDLLVEDCVKIDVKASRLYRGKQGNFYSFNLEKSFAICDFYMLATIDELNNVSRWMVIPSNLVIANNQISIGEITSKYHKFTDRFELIDEAAAFWSDLIVETRGVVNDEV